LILRILFQQIVYSQTFHQTLYFPSDFFFGEDFCDYSFFVENFDISENNIISAELAQVPTVVMNQITFWNYGELSKLSTWRLALGVIKLRVWVLNNWWNLAKLHKKKAPKRRKEKETREPGPKSRQGNSPKKAGRREESEPLRTEPFHHATWSIN
jgi:hypothetical protein